MSNGNPPRFGRPDYEDLDFVSAEEEARVIAEHSAEIDSTHLVVAEIGPGRDDITDEFSPLQFLRLPLAPVPAIDQMRRRLLAYCPHAHAAISNILNDLAGKAHVSMPPTVLVGPPGCGKNFLATKLARVLGLPLTVYNCAAAGDATLVGASRHWTGGGPCLPLQLIRRYRVASPCVMLDELDKCATSRNNGRLLDALLPLLEASTAATFHDPWLQSSVDLSRVIWLAVANDVEPLTGPLRDRMRILTVPAPGPEHLEALANAMILSKAQDLGIAPAWATPLDAAELSSLEEVWRGGSLRPLRRYVDVVMRSRFDPASSPRH